MKVKDLIANLGFESVHEGEPDREISSVYCCDLLSWVMGRASADSAWITVMGNMNSVAVAVLADISVIVLAENAPIDSAALEKAKQQGVNILKTDKPAFEAGLLINNGL
ncbi:MAG: DRTGG domain-containing protein [Oscillospiraceae bacterium]|nr:DRTGG domain-containing protein [Oscillospiraceae bacterium]